MHVDALSAYEIGRAWCVRAGKRPLVLRSEDGKYETYRWLTHRSDSESKTLAHELPGAIGDLTSRAIVYLDHVSLLLAYETVGQALIDVWAAASDSPKDLITREAIEAVKKEHRNRDLTKLWAITDVAVCATRFEQDCLDRTYGPQFVPVRLDPTGGGSEWSEKAEIGRIGQYPVYLDLRWVRIAGRVVLFWDYHPDNVLTSADLAHDWFRTTWRAYSHDRRFGASQFDDCLRLIYRLCKGD